jgi:ectoine hydroxylase-related dioxygenase (phytanoyl-CoA dioxygenase family)
MNLDELTAEAFWRRHFPALAIGGEGPAPAVAAPPDAAIKAERMAEDGYVQGRAEALARLAPPLAAAVTKLKAMALPPPFLFLFDEAWQAFAALAPDLSLFLGAWRILPDFWVWHVDPTAGEAGWTPHVDKGARALDADGRPLSLTAWIPLTPATPLNGCIYVVPASRDPQYGAGAGQRTTPFALPAVRALPVEPGDYLIWNQAVLHWGGASSRFAESPRLSMALEFQRADIAPFNRPLIDPAAPLPFSERLRLVGKQILQYRHMYPLTGEMERLARALTG